MSGDQQLGAIQGQVSSLYVTNIPPQINESDLFAVYSSNDSTNRIQALRIVRGQDGQAKYAYLNFASPEEALDVLNTMNYRTFGDYEITLAKNIKPQSLNPSANLYISSFSGKVANKDLHDAFSAFGPIASACTRVIDANGVEKFSAYVQYESTESADAAIASIQQNGLQLPGGRVERVTIDRFKPRSARENQFTNVFVRNFPINFNADQFKALAERYGSVTSVYLPQTFAPKPGTTAPSQTGFGFANYASAEDARKAIQALNEEVVGEFKLQAFKAKDRVARRREVDENSAKYSRSDNTTRYNRGYQSQPRSSSILLKNMPADMTLAQISEKLAAFGEIISLNKRANFNSYICKFAKPEMASAAHAALSKQYAVTFYVSQGGFQRKQRQPFQQRRPRHHRQYPRYPYPFPPYGFAPVPAGQYGYMQQGVPQHPQGPHPGVPQQHPGRMQTRRHRMQQEQQQQPQQQMQQQPQQPSGPLSEDERQQLGSTLYYKIAGLVEQNTELTSKITGMLLELPVDDVRALVGNDAALADKIKEARQVLQQQ